MDRELGARGIKPPLAAADAVHRHHNIQHHLDRYGKHEPQLSTIHHSSTPLPAPVSDDSSYKQLKEAWIAHQTGSSIHVINLLGLVMLLTYAIWSVLRAKRLRFVRETRQLRPSELGYSALSYLVAALAGLGDWQLEFLILVAPAVCAHTILATHLVATNCALLVLLVLLIRSEPSLSPKRSSIREQKQKRHWSKKFSDDEDQDDDDSRHKIAKASSFVTSSATIEVEPPFRVSIDSAADAAHAAAAPPNFYDGPGSAFRSDLDLSIDTSMITAPQSPVAASAASSSSFRVFEASFLSPDLASTSTFASSSPSRRSAELTALKTAPMQLLHSRDGSDAQSVVSASSAMSPLARSVVDPWGKGKQPPSIDHSTWTSHTEDSPSYTTSPTNSNSIGGSPVLQHHRSLDSSNLFVRPQPFLTVYRAHMMLVTIISILAVDFSVFPRFLSKCESWGTSWMDMGVGSFVFSLGIISALPFLKNPRNRFRPLRQQLVSDFRKALPLVALGSIRIIMVKGVEYPEHVSEYGVHWNFFITLSMLPFAATLSRPFSRWIRYSVLGILLSVLHQVLLNCTSWQTWAISDTIQRTTLLAQNKEGLTSMVGYLAIFYIGLDLGHYVLPLDPYFAYRKFSRRRSKPRTHKLAMILASLAILWWMGYGVSSIVGLRTSRRLANLPYVLWVAAFNTSFLLCYVMVYMLILQPVEQQEQQEQQEQRQSTPTQQRDSVTALILQDLNRHSLTVFLAANLLTGLVNLTLKTMYIRDAVAVVILLAYTGICCGLARWLTRRNIRLKL